MKLDKFWIGVVIIIVAGFIFTKSFDNEFYFFTTYVVLQGIIIAVAWNILGGFTGYVNFGSAGFFAVGVYTSVALNKAFGLPLPVLVLASGSICALLGLAAGYLTLRLKGIYFAIATLAVALMLETVANNWEYVGGAAGTYVLQPKESFIFDNYTELLFMLMLLLAIAATAVSRYLSSSRLGQGLSAIRDDELAAECTGVPTLKLKLISATTMGFFMGAAGAPFPWLPAARRLQYRGLFAWYEKCTAN
ncbi:MAG: branched-chain amino acid ABC transporter permease [Proteobacteria bacterium]|nr:branched-chain amino acid ABC transporter permease [Pseudomonadota bacterium]